MIRQIRGLAALCSIAGLVVLNSCGGADGNAPDCDPIQAALVSRIEIAPGAVTVITGDSLQLQAKAFSCAGELSDVTSFEWHGSNDGIATVSPTGLVKALTSGNATVYASTAGREGSAMVLSRPPRVAEVQVEPATATLGVNQSNTLTARAFDNQGRELFGRAVAWSSARASVVAVDAEGQITGVSAGGPFSVTATIDGKSGASRVTVVNLVVDQVEVSPSAPSIGPGATVQLNARLTDALNHELSGRVVSWTTTNGLVASVNRTSGLVTGVLPGTAFVIATSEGKSDSARVTVSLTPAGTPQASSRLD